MPDKDEELTPDELESGFVDWDESEGEDIVPDSKLEPNGSER